MEQPTSLKATAPPRSFDAWLCHAHEDLVWARQLYEMLAERRLRIWFAPQVIHVGDSVVLAREAGLITGLPLLLIVPSPDAPADWHQLEWTSALAGDPGRPEDRFIPLLLPGRRLPFLLGAIQPLTTRALPDAALINELERAIFERQRRMRSWQELEDVRVERRAQEALSVLERLVRVHHPPCGLSRLASALQFAKMVEAAGIALSLSVRSWLEDNESLTFPVRTWASLSGLSRLPREEQAALVPALARAWDDSPAVGRVVSLLLFARAGTEVALAQLLRRSRAPDLTTPLLSPLAGILLALAGGPNEVFIRAWGRALAAGRTSRFEGGCLYLEDGPPIEELEADGVVDAEDGPAYVSLRLPRFVFGGDRPIRGSVRVSLLPTGAAADQMARPIILDPRSWCGPFVIEGTDAGPRPRFLGGGVR